MKEKGLSCPEKNSVAATVTCCYALLISSTNMNVKLKCEFLSLILNLKKAKAHDLDYQSIRYKLKNFVKAAVNAQRLDFIEKNVCRRLLHDQHISIHHSCSGKLCIVYTQDGVVTIWP